MAKKHSEPGKIHLRIVDVTKQVLLADFKSVNYRLGTDNNCDFWALCRECRPAVAHRALRIEIPSIVSNP